MAKLLLIFLLALAPDTKPGISPEDSARFVQFIQYARAQGLERLPHQERMTLIGEFFLGLPYEGGTLDRSGREELVVNLRAMDCVTFVDNVLSLALLDRYDPASLPAWLRELRRVRYRGGKIDGYASRLHYSTDWLHEMCREGILRDMTRELGGIPFPGQVGLITATADKRPAFRDDTSQLSKMRAVERAINGREKLYIPRGRVTPELCQKIQDGDIILFTTDKKGLDTAHVGIACRRNGATCVMHASLGKREVTVSQESLAGYLEKIPSHSGIIIARLNY